MFGARLKQIREGRGVSQQQLADAAGVSLRAVSHWEQGLRSPSWDAVQAVCRALDVDCTVFQDGAGEPAGPTPATRPRGRPRKTPEPGKPKGRKRGGE